MLVCGLVVAVLIVKFDDRAQTRWAETTWSITRGPIRFLLLEIECQGSQLMGIGVSLTCLQRESILDKCQSSGTWYERLNQERRAIPVLFNHCHPENYFVPAFNVYGLYVLILRETNKVIGKTVHTLYRKEVLASAFRLRKE